MMNESVTSCRTHFCDVACCMHAGQNGSMNLLASFVAFSSRLAIRDVVMHPSLLSCGLSNLVL